jgi:hypothetical protein
VKASLRRQLTVPVALLALAATGCSQIDNGGIAARIGDRTVTTSELVADMRSSANGSASPGADATAVPATADAGASQRTVLRTLIRLEELRLLASRDALPSTVSDADRNAMVTQLGGDAGVQSSMSSAGIDAGLRTQFLDTEVLAQRLLAKWVPVSDALLQKTYDDNLANFVQADVKFATVPTQAEATVLAQKVRANVSAFDSLSAAAKAPVQQTGLHPATDFGQTFGPQIAQGAVGDVITGQAGTSGWVVILVTKHVVQPLAAVKDQVAAQARSASSQQAFTQHFQALEVSDPVRVNPRFGSWDAVASNVVALPSDTVQANGAAANPLDTGLTPDSGSGAGATDGSGTGPTDTPSPGSSATP